VSKIAPAIARKRPWTKALACPVVIFVPPIGTGGRYFLSGLTTAGSPTLAVPGANLGVA
jgi:hypothetical protein